MKKTRSSLAADRQSAGFNKSSKKPAKKKSAFLAANDSGAAPEVAAELVEAAVDIATYLPKKAAAGLGQGGTFGGAGASGDFSEAAPAGIESAGEAASTLSEFASAAGEMLSSAGSALAEGAGNAAEVAGDIAGGIVSVIGEIASGL